jgi:acyl-CoA synthetase (NDP forming)
MIFMKKNFKRNLKNFFNPKIIAIIGASNSKGKVGNILMEKLEKFNGKTIPINLKKREILGKKAYSSVKNYRNKIDLAIIATPVKTVKKILEECGKKRIKNVIIVSSGFSEIGNKKSEEEISKIAKRYKMNLLGPNCFGIANPFLSLDTTFAKNSVKKGSTAFISQSGALWSCLSDKKNAKYSGFVSLGNMADLSFTDFIEYFNKDKNTKRIILYVEKIKNGKEFMELCKKSKKEIIAVKAGESKESSKAAISHTGSLATDYRVYEGVFKQANIRIAKTLYSAIENKKQNFIKPEKNKNKVIIITNAGGAGAIITDLCKKNNFEIAKTSKKFKTNPVDLLGTATAEEYRNILKKLEKENFYDVAIITLTPQTMTEPEKVAEEIVEFLKKIKNKRIIACFLGEKSMKESVNLMRKNKIKVLTNCY